MPSGFPPDVPVYPGSRLTAEAQFASSGQTTWGLEWETLDGVDKVKAFFAGKLASADWTISSSATANGVYSATFTRKSNSKVSGILGVDGSSGVTTISLALATPG